MLKVLDVDGAVQRVSGGWTATGQRLGLRRRPLRAGRRRPGRRAAGDARLRRHVRLPDAVPAPAARRPGGARRLGARRAAAATAAPGRSLPADVTPEALAAAQAALGRPGVEVEPRKMWPTGLAEVKGRIPAGLQAESGRALGRLSDIGWGTRLRALLGGPDGPVPDEVLRAVVDVLKGWGWEQRPTGVVVVPSRTRPQLVDSLGARLAEVGRLPLLGTLDLLRDVPPGAGRSNSAQRLRAVHGAFGVPPAMALDGRPRAARRRRRRLRLDAHRGHPRAARGGRRPGAAAGARAGRLSGPAARPRRPYARRHDLGPATARRADRPHVRRSPAPTAASGSRRRATSSAAGRTSCSPCATSPRASRPAPACTGPGSASVVELDLADLDSVAQCAKTGARRARQPGRRWSATPASWAARCS